jgi:hypothetical protein
MRKRGRVKREGGMRRKRRRDNFPSSIVWN